MKFKVGDKVRYNSNDWDIKLIGIGKIQFISDVSDDGFIYVTLEKRHVAIARSVGYAVYNGSLPFYKREIKFEEDSFTDLLKKAKEIRRLGEKIIKEKCDEM